MADECPHILKRGGLFVGSTIYGCALRTKRSYRREIHVDHCRLGFACPIRQDFAEARVAELLEALEPLSVEIDPKMADRETIPVYVRASDVRRANVLLRSRAAPKSPPPIREEVRWFSDEMERKLRENDHKGDFCRLDGSPPPAGCL
ncbi:MAG: hypothetical protein WBK88_04510 [Methanothrix sp.]